jgi:hypothetical protein
LSEHGACFSARLDPLRVSQLKTGSEDAEPKLKFDKKIQFLSFIYSFAHSFNRSFCSLYPLPQRVLHRVRSSASSFYLSVYVKYLIETEVKVKVKFNPEQTKKDQRGSRSITVLFL